jgi:hypothetical protein
MCCGNSAWPKKQARRSFWLWKTVEYLACNGEEGKRKQQFPKRQEKEIKYWRVAAGF